MNFFTHTLTMTRTMLCMLLIIEFGSNFVIGEVYKVGDSAGWTSNINSTYTNWASSKTFRVKDVILFEYNSTKDNVIQVTHDEFRTCNTSAPKRMFNSGNDSFTIIAPGHYYFTSNFSGHCEAGQKLDVRVLKNPPPSPTVTPSSSPISSPSPSPSNDESNAVAPSPSENVASTHNPHWLFTIIMAVTSIVGLFRGCV